MKRLKFVLVLLAWLQISWTWIGVVVLHNTSGEARGIYWGDELACERVVVVDGVVFENTLPCYIYPEGAMEFYGITETGVAFMLGNYGAGSSITMNARCMTAYDMNFWEWADYHINGTLEGGWKVACDEQ